MPKQRVQNKPYWEEVAGPATDGALDHDLRVDVAIVGGGITGLTAAFLLRRAGLEVAVLDRHEIAQGMSAHTTAHLTQIFDTPLDTLVRAFGRDEAATVWHAGREAIDFIAHVARTEAIDCGFARVPAYFFASDEAGVEAVEREAELARGLGFPADVVEDLPFPPASFAAMRVASQAQFHPRRYLRGLAERVRTEGGHLFADTAYEALEGSSPFRLRANGHTITAAHVVFATHQPLNRLVLTAKVIASQTYALGARVARGAFPQALAWDTADPYRYWRQAPEAEADMLIVGGQDHRTGHDDDTAARYEALERYLAHALGATRYQLAYRWTGQILNPVDGVPLIGRSGEAEQAYVGTGYMGNGMTMGTYAALVIADLIQGRERPEAQLFDPRRWNVRGMVTMMRDNLAYPTHLVGDRLSEPKEDALNGLAPGEGRVVELAGQHVAVSRAEDGTVTACSAVCTHMGCLVHWNAADTSWDCPCHGSRFQADGEVVSGPAITALAPVELPERVTIERIEAQARTPREP